VEALDAHIINAALGAEAGRFRLAVIDRCDSTNTWLLDQPPPCDDAIEVVACEWQTGGRGRRGRSWLSAPEASLTFSLRWRFAAGVPPVAGLSLAVGVAVAQALERMGAAGVQLKWPNDILASVGKRGGKLGGILVETQSQGGMTVAVIGIGLNVRLPASIAKAVSESGGVDAADIVSVMQAAPSRNLLLASLLLELASALARFSQSGFAVFVDDWQARNAYVDRTVRILDHGAETIEGRCVGVDSDGALLLDTRVGLRRIVNGEVSLRL